MVLALPGETQGILTCSQGPTRVRGPDHEPTLCLVRGPPDHCSALELGWGLDAWVGLAPCCCCREPVSASLSQNLTLWTVDTWCGERRDTWSRAVLLSSG